MSYVETARNKRRRLVGDDEASTGQSSDRTSASGPATGHPLVVNNNSNVTYAPGGFVINYNPAETNVYMGEASPDELDVVAKGLSQLHVPRAVFDAAPSDAGCMTGTRVQLLKDSTEIIKTIGGPHILWIAGMAGSGKTTIALTLCQTWAMDDSIILGGTFFCSRSAGAVERTDAQRIIPTLAMVLARELPEYARSLAAELENDPDLGHKSIRLQVERILSKPLEGLGSLGRQIVFVVDALDECSDPRKVAELINAIADFQSHAPVKFLLTSRPEMHIRETSIADTSLSSIVQLHMVDETLVTADIRLYIKRTLEKVSSPSLWYTEDDLDDLASLSGCLFIFASTALAYILRRKDTPGRLERMRTVKMQTSTSTLATAALDKIYSLTLMQASDLDAYEPVELDETRRIVAVILSTRAPLTIKALAELLGLSPEHLRGALEELHAVVFVPEDDDDGELRALHASFGDFVFLRAPDHLRIRKDLGEDALAEGCLRRLAEDDLCFNVSRSETSFEPNPETEPDWIAHSLRYACLHWAHHVSRASITSSLDVNVGSFIRLKLLFWLEVLSIIDKVSLASGLLYIATLAVKSEDVSRLLRDANYFVTSSHEAIERSAPHIYLSALPFAAKNSLVRKNFSPFLTGILSTTAFGIDREGGPCLMVLTGHDKIVRTIAYSPDSTVLASGSDDGTVRLWDTRSGEEKREPLTVGEEQVKSVAFTPDGHQLIAGTSDGMILVWDARTFRLLLPPFRGHTDLIGAIAISRNGAIIASASNDSTIGLWSTDTGHPAGELLRGHEGAVYTVSFSPKGDLLASGGYDSTVRIWDYGRGELAVEPLREHKAPTLSVTFSADGALLASGSENKIVRVWNVVNGHQLHVYSGHQGWVTSVAFAPDGHTLASGSFDLTVRVWQINDANNQTTPLILRGHSRSIFAVSFSKDSRYIASGSSDHTTRVWDVATASASDPPLNGHADQVQAVAVSRDCRLIASASLDGSARVWSAETCEQMCPPLLGHEGSVHSVAFSPDSRWIATGSTDAKVRVWNAQTGQLAFSELVGHEGAVNGVAFSSDGLHIASGSDDATVRIWEFSTRHPVQMLRLTCEQPVWPVVYSPEGELIAAGDSEGNIWLFEAATGQQVRFFESTYGSGIVSLSFSPDGAHIVSASEVGIAGVDTRTGDTFFGNEDCIVDGSTVAYTPGGHIIASGSNDCTISLFDAMSLELIEPVLHGHAGAIRSIVCSSDGRFLVTGSTDKTVRIWNIDDVRLLDEESDPKPLNALAFARHEDDGWLISPSEELLLWVPPEYRGHLEIGGYSQVIATHRVFVAADDGVLHQGEEWTRCWRSPARTTPLPNEKHA